MGPLHCSEMKLRFRSNTETAIPRAVITLSVNLQPHPPTLGSQFHTHSYLLHTPTNKGSILSLQSYVLSPLLLLPSPHSQQLINRVCWHKGAHPRTLVSSTTSSCLLCSHKIAFQFRNDEVTAPYTARNLGRIPCSNEKGYM